ncbi:MAG: glucose-1-phosphate adenylyltransferase [Clostridia bacterium]|nr:glucose-1-phosphate adenylyltransferase [Clostridia bacterium]
MYHKKECVAMLLAGGQGSRLYTLTEKTAKPAVPFGGKYRIIDFPLSNCVNSGIDTVGVLTQYQPLELNEYIGNGQAWDLDRTFGGVMVLPPYQGNKSADWYKGTANAIYQNLAFIDRYDPEYVLVLSGDHIYKMDYAAMLDFHKKTEADCTIAVLNVTLEEASRFGIMNTDDNGKIYEFEEKPAHPKSTKASMGIYMFNYKKLKQYLIEDENTEGSANDFGKNIIPNMLAAGESMYAYPFSGYWKDVGTVSSLWEANMDLLGENPVFNLHDRSWRIFSRTSASPAQFIGERGVIDNVLVSEGCEIMGTVKDSVLFNGVTVEEGATVTNSVVMGGVTIKAGTTVNNVIIAENTTVGANATIGDGTKPGDNITILGSDLSIPDGMVIGGGLLVNAEKLNELV